MAKHPNGPPAETLIDSATRLMKELADCDGKIAIAIAIAKQVANVSADDKAKKIADAKAKEIADLTSDRATLLTKLVENVGQLLDARDACNNEIDELARAGHSTITLERRRDAVKHALPAPLAELQRTVEKFGDDAISAAYKLADDEKKPARFYSGINPSVFKPEAEKVTAEKGRDLDAITQVTISKADAAREVNRLLDLTSATRIAEEMDIVTYHAEATRLFERVRAEFNDISEDFSTAFQNEILDEQNKISNFRKEIAPFDAIAKRLTEENSELGVALSGFHKRAIEANRFLGRYRQFVGYEKKCADLMKDDFASESSVKAYKDATRSHAERIEKQGVFSSFWTILAGLAAAVLIAFVLIFLDNNLLLKNWTIAAMLGAAALMYGFSVKFGRDARNDHMHDLRETLYARACEIREVAKSGANLAPGLVEISARTEAAAIEMKTNPHFEFPKIKWGDFEEKANDQSKPTNVAEIPAGIDTHQTVKDERSILASELGEDTWSSHEKIMWDRNLRSLTLIVAVPLVLSLGLGTWGPTKTFSFVSQTPDLGACVLERGRVLLATGGSYFVRTVEGSHVTEIAKSAVLLIEPGEPKPPLPNCAERRAEPGPTHISFDAALEVKPDQATLDAAGKIAANAHAWLDAIADKIGADTLCTKSCPPVTTVTSPAPFPVIVPVVVETQPPTAAPEVRVGGPTFTTLVQGVDGKTREYNEQRLVVLPFFPGPVSGKTRPEIYGEDGINTTAEAFYFGLHQLSDPPLSNPPETLIQRIGNAFKTCMDQTQAAYKSKGKAATRKLILRVEGYASQTWLNIKGVDGRLLDKKAKERLNWYLAEGRRAAVIRQLSVAGRELIEIKPTPAEAKFDDLGDIDPEKVKSNFQFDGYDKMTESLDDWLKQPASDDRQPDEEREILARSVVILIDNDELARCGEAD
ncbi:hypothetical protein NKI15_22260 [Mesorhizobium sp. M0862]|uniref:hypothetical protein n=1 Tax=Mesorhizobium sp. M0862 TaxID=2957015 RepID=UPI003338BE4F